MVDLDGNQERGLQPAIQLQTKEADRYVRKREIARGGMGRIVLAYDRQLNREVAIKEQLSPSLSFKNRLEREISITARLQHPAIIALHSAGRWPTGEPFFTMKHVAGRSFEHVLAEKVTLRDRLALLPNVIAVADALAYAHSREVVHRDLKPANVLIGDFGETVVIDWGLAKDLTSGAPHGDDESPSLSRLSASPALTVAGTAIGTPSYMAPEQAAGKLIDKRSDVYSLGSMLYHLISGVIPYLDSRFSGAHELVQMVIDGPPTPLARIAPDAPPDLCAIVEKAMARAPSARYPSADALVEDLKRFATGQLVGARTYSRRQRFRRWLGSHWKAVSAAVIMSLILSIGGAVSLWRIAEERGRTSEQRALAERAQLARDRAEATARATELTLGVELADVKKRLDFARDAADTARTEADRATARAAIDRLEAQKAQVELAKAKARAERIKRVEVSVECMNNPLAAGCM